MFVDYNTLKIHYIMHSNTKHLLATPNKYWPCQEKCILILPNIIFAIKNNIVISTNFTPVTKNNIAKLSNDVLPQKTDILKQATVTKN